MIKEYVLENDNLYVKFADVGGSLLEIRMKEEGKRSDNMLLRYELTEDYGVNKSFMGCIVGRSAGRTGQGTFTIGTETYQIEKNVMGNNLHSGKAGVHLVRWNVEKIENGFLLTHKSLDMEGGFPGNVEFKAIYKLEGNKFTTSIEAVSDKDTYLNMTMHPYLKVDSSGYLYDTYITIEADEKCITDGNLLPDGSYQKVEGTKYDLREETLLEAIKVNGGYDDVWKLAGEGRVVLESKDRKRKITMKSNQSHVVVFTLNGVDSYKVTGNRLANVHEAVAVEFQDMPNEINVGKDRTTLLRKGDRYLNTVEYTFE